MFIEPHLHMPSLEFQQQSLVPKPTATSGRALALNALMLPLAEEAGVNDPSITDPSTPNERTPALGVTPYGATSTSQRIAEIECPVILSTSSSHTQTRNKPAVSSRKSKHGQTERYFCTSSNCDRSQLGRGFNRKDHLTQHLRVHKSKKRSHESDGENGQPSRDSFLEELAEERRLRLLANQENCRLQQKLENYEERMQKYEDRLDRMMNLIESHRSKQTEEIWTKGHARIIDDGKTMYSIFLLLGEGMWPALCVG